MRLWAALLALLLTGGAFSQSVSETEYEAKRYLNSCLTAVAAAAIHLPNGLTSNLNGLPCDYPAFRLATYFDGKTRSPAVAHSRINVGSGGFAGFEVTVTDRQGREWTGSPLGPLELPLNPSLTPEQLAQAQAAALQTAAQNVLRNCITALEEYKIIHLDKLNTDWNGKSCQAAGLISEASGAAVSKSLVTLHPESVEGYQVTVWPKTGEAVTLPEVLTSGPTRLQRFYNSGELARWVMMLTLGVVVSVPLLYFTAIKLPSHEVVGLIGWIVIVIALIMVVNYFSNRLRLDEWGYLLLMPAIVLVITVSITIPRLVYWFEREEWWLSLGMGGTAAFITTFFLGLVIVLSAQGSLIALLAVSLCFTVYGLWQRWRTRLSRPAP